MSTQSPDVGFAAAIESIDVLASHVQLLWQAVDELRSDLQWAAQNGRIVVDAETVFTPDDKALSVPVDLVTVVHDLDAVTKRLSTASREIAAVVQSSSQQPLADSSAATLNAPPGHLF